MQQLIFTVYDSKAEAYLQPFYAVTVEVAKRNIRTAMSDASHQFSLYPGDYTLFEIGSFSDATGNLERLEAKVNHGTALELGRARGQVDGN